MIWTIHQIFQISATSLAVTLNTFLLFIILKYSSDLIGSYKYFLFAYTLNAALYSCTQFFLLENWYMPTHRAGYLFFSSVGLFPRIFHIWLIYAFIGLFHMNLFIICWSFLYRLTVFSQRTFFFRSWSNILMLGAATVLLEAFTIFDAWLLHPTDRTDEEYQEILSNLTGRPIEDIGYIGGSFVYDDGLNLNLAVSISVNGGINACVNVFITYAWFGIRRRIAEQDRLAGSAHTIHYRLYILLTLQSLCPIIFNSTPVILAIILSIFHVNIGNYLLLCGDAMNIAQVLDPLCILFCVTDYRRAIVKIVLGHDIENNQVESTITRQNVSSSWTATRR